jgi:hypothetical protein
MSKTMTVLTSTFAAAGAALLIAAPIARADDPAPCAPDDQQCLAQQQQQQGQQIADQVTDGVKKGLDATRKVYDDGNTASPGWMSLLDGEPYCMHMGAHIKPGVIVTNPDPTGIAHPC